METKTYLVSNNGEGSICLAGSRRVDIPGLCVDYPIELPADTARRTISRLKQRYPLLKITEAKGAADKARAAQAQEKPEAPAPANPAAASVKIEPAADQAPEKAADQAAQADSSAKKK